MAQISINWDIEVSPANSASVSCVPGTKSERTSANIILNNTVIHKNDIMVLVLSTGFITYY